MSLDLRGLRLARSFGHSPEAERTVARFSRLGEHGGVWLLIAALGQSLEPTRGASWRRAGASVAVAYVLNTAIKLAIARPRPELADLPPLTATPTGLSFPSAHASTSFAGALAYSRLGLPAAGLYGLAGALSYSRLYLGVHYPSDVVAGAALGTAVAALSIARSRAEGGRI